MHFSYIRVPSQKYGSFGSLECQFCPDDYFPKYEALVDYQEDCAPTTSVSHPLPDNAWIVAKSAGDGHTFVQWAVDQPG